MRSTLAAKNHLPRPDFRATNTGCGETQSQSIQYPRRYNNPPRRPFVTHSVTLPSNNPPHSLPHSSRQRVPTFPPTAGRISSDHPSDSSRERRHNPLLALHRPLPWLAPTTAPQKLQPQIYRRSIPPPLPRRFLRQSFLLRRSLHQSLWMAGLRALWRRGLGGKGRQSTRTVDCGCNAFFPRSGGRVGFGC